MIILSKSSDDEDKSIFDGSSNDGGNESNDSDEDYDNDNNDNGNSDDKNSETVKNPNGFPNMAATDSDIPSTRVSETHSKEGSTSPAIPRLNEKYLDMSVPFSHKVPDVTLCQSVDKSITKRSLPPSPQVYRPTTSVKSQHKSKLVQAHTIRSDRTSPQPPAKRRSCSVPPPHRHDQTANLRKKKFVSLKFFDPFKGNNAQSKRSKKPKAKRNSVSKPKSPTALASDGEMISDSSSLIRRCNMRILSRPDASTDSKGSVSMEVDKTIEIGNDLGFSMTGKNDDVALILGNGIQETMTPSADQFLIKQLWNNTPYEFAVKESDGKSGGIIAVWDCTSFSLISTTVGDGFLALLGTWQSLSVPCLMVVVYAPQSQAKKNKLWHDLASLINSHDNLSVVMGD
ncbi:cytochrome P450, partial [Tanacetum coccineum]